MHSFWQETFPNYLTAIGTVGATITALCGHQIRTWANRPHISITAYNKEPYVVEQTGNTNTNSSDKELTIRVKVLNTGKYNAMYSALYVDSYYFKREDGDYVKNSFTPIQLKDFHGTKPQIISSNLPFYFDVLSIRKHDDMTSASGSGKSKQNYRVFLLGDGMQKQLGKGVFIIPIRFYSSSIKPVISYLKVVWLSDSYQKESSCFSIGTISENDFNSLKKVEK